MPVFYLNDEDIHKLQRRFNLFKRERILIHNLLDNYVADYRQFSGSMSKRYEYLRKKYISQSPDLTHLILLDGAILWSTQDISIVLGRHITTIIRSINKLERTEGWSSRLLSIRVNTKNQNGRSVSVYHKDIFDLLLDLYEDEYLLRFSQPRRGDNNSAPDIQELRRFWQYLKDFDNFNPHVVQQHKHLPDIPPMGWKDITSLIWHKVFSLKVSTVASFLFAVCFELARRTLGVHLWFVIVPAVIAVISAVLIHSRRFSPDTLSNFGAGALLFTMLWVSAVFSSDTLTHEINTPEENIVNQNVILTPTRAGLHEQLSLTINTQHYSNVKEFFFRISPDIQFHSTGFLQQSNTLLPPAPNNLISVPNNNDISYIDVKFIDIHDLESSIKHFSFDVPLELFKLDKHFILSSKEPWVIAKFIGDGVTIDVNPIIESNEGKKSIDSFVYGINTLSPDNAINILHQRDKFNKWFNRGQILFDKDNYIHFVSSYLIFSDGSTSDVRISRVRQ